MMRVRDCILVGGGGEAGEALRSAAMGGDVAAVERLLATGADVDAADGVRWRSPARSARVCVRRRVGGGVGGAYLPRAS